MVLRGAIAVYTEPRRRQTYCADSLARFFGRKLVQGWDGLSPLDPDGLAVVNFLPNLDMAPNVLSLGIATEIIRGQLPGLRATGVSVDELDG